MELRVGNKYRLGRKIGSGSFGDIFLGTGLLEEARGARVRSAAGAGQALLALPCDLSADIACNVDGFSCSGYA
jgi:hypothetical protein